MQVYPLIPLTCSHQPMQENYIPLIDCRKGHVYRLNSRNLSFGVFDGQKGFIGIREKFGNRFLFTEDHWDCGAPFGTVHPLEEIGKLPDTIPATERDYHCPESADWATDPITGQPRPSIRRNLRPGEPQHGQRQGFVDEWKDTKERLPDKVYPYLRGNSQLFKWLDDLEATANQK